jgi:polygalacturonase
VFNHASFNNDGLNIDSCRDVHVTGCRIDSDDDGIVLKSLSSTPCRNVTVEDCVVSSHCNALKMGTESGGGFQKIRIRDCRVHSPRKSKAIYGRQRGLAGIALEIVDGGEMSDVRVEQIRIDGVSVPIFVRLGNRARRYESGQAKPSIGALHDVLIQDVIARGTGDIGCSITGLPGHPVRDVTLKNIDLEFDGGGTADLVDRQIPEKPESYPESTMFGQLPSWGFFCRHVEGLTLDGLKLSTKKDDLRHALYLEDVAGFSLRRFEVEPSPNAAPLIETRDVREASGLRLD